jgi:hypothetical protein
MGKRTSGVIQRETLAGKNRVPKSMKNEAGNGGSSRSCVDEAETWHGEKSSDEEMGTGCQIKTATGNKKSSRRTARVDEKPAKKTSVENRERATQANSDLSPTNSTSKVHKLNFPLKPKQVSNTHGGHRPPSLI